MNLTVGLNIFVLIVFTFCRTTQSIDNYCDDVKEWGFHCASCTTMINCIQLPTGDWKPISIGSCDNSKAEYCNRKEQQCSKEKDCSIEKPEKFQCNMEGTFPDPYDCGKYYVCANVKGNLTAFGMVCLNNEFGYSAKTKECSLNKTSKYCKNRQFICKKSGDMAPWPENPQIFYVCVQKKVGTDINVYPQLFQCKYGEEFNGQQCIKNNNTTTIMPPLTPGDGEPDPHPSDSPIVGLCEKEGLFKNPYDCRKYFICNKNLIKQESTCPSNTHFDDHIKACVIGAKC